jgi:hypothetical protein
LEKGAGVLNHSKREEPMCSTAHEEGSWYAYPHTMRGNCSTADEEESKYAEVLTSEVG